MGILIWCVLVGVIYAVISLYIDYKRDTKDTKDNDNWLEEDNISLISLKNSTNCKITIGNVVMNYKPLADIVELQLTSWTIQWVMYKAREMMQEKGYTDMSKVRLDCTPQFETKLLLSKLMELDEFKDIQVKVNPTAKYTYFATDGYCITIYTENGSEWTI